MSVLGIKRKLLNQTGGNSNQLYSARLFRTENSAIFCMCLYHPLYMQQCEKVIASKYTVTQEPIEYNCVTLSSNEVTIRASENNEWKVTFFQRPKISRTEIEIQEDYQGKFEELLKIDYPPRIVIGVTPMTPNPKPLELHVEGLDRECTFKLLPDQAESLVDSLPASPKRKSNEYNEIDENGRKAMVRVHSSVGPEHIL